MSNNNKLVIVPKRTNYSVYPPITAPEIPITLNVNLLKDVHSVQTSSYKCDRMMQYIIGFLKKKKNVHVQEDAYGNIYATKGNADLYPAIVSHTDTVHSIHEHFQVMQDENIIWAFSNDKRTQVGVGGDDKVGVFMCLSMLELLPKVKIAFFKDEEVGCIGSGRANMQFFDDCGFVLQCDRKGSDDFIYNAGTELYGANFEKAVAPYLEKHGYRETTGLMTDVLELKGKGLAVACANMSCGYYSPHSDNEVLDLNAVQKCYNLVSELMLDFIDTRFPHDKNNKHSKGGYSYSYSGYGYGRDNDDDFDNYDYGRSSYFRNDNRENIEDDETDFDDIYNNGGLSISEDDILENWGLTKKENDYYAVNDKCKECKEILEEDIDGIKLCPCCNSYKHIPKMYLRDTI